MRKSGHFMKAVMHITSIEVCLLVMATTTPVVENPYIPKGTD